MKKMLSVLLAASLIFGTFTVDIYAENADKIFSAANIFVNSANDDVICDGVTFGQTAEEPTYSNGKVYKECGIFGLSENEYGIEIIAREQRVDKPYMSFDFGDVDASGDFYITQKVYIGQSRDNDLIRLGAPLKKSDGTELKNDQNFQGYKYFQGSGQVKFRDDKLSDATKYQNASCATNNWVNYTVAGTGGEIATYVDGVKFDSGWVDGISGGNKTVTYSGTLTDVQTAIRFQTADTAVGLPSFAVLKEAKLIYGTYDPEQSKTVITSTAYTVPQATVLLGSSTSNPAKVETVVSGVPSGETVSAFLGNITVPSGASKSVIKLNNATKATIAVAGSDALSSDMMLLVKSADGSMKLYDIELSDTPEITSSLTRYVVNSTDKTITMPDTTVEKLKSVVTGTNGTTVKVVNAAGAEVTTGTVRETMKLIAEKNGVSEKYSIILSGNTVAYNQDSRLGSLTDEQNLFDATIDASGTKTNTYIYPAATPSEAKSLYGLHNGSSGYTHFTNAFAKAKGSNFTYNIKKSKLPGTDVSAYHFTNVVAEGGSRNWYFHQSNALSLGTNTNNATKGDKMVINFKVYIESGGFAFWPMHTTSGGGGYELQLNNSTNKQTSDRVIFTSNKIQLGGERRDYTWGGSSGSYLADMSTYELNRLYDVTIVESRGTTVYNGVERETVVTEGVYLDGVRLANSSATCVILDGRSYVGIRDFAFATLGNVYFGGLTITMTDNYDPTPYTMPESADLTISSSSVEINTADSYFNGVKTVRGYSGTVADLKAAITKDENAKTEILDRTGTSVLADSTVLADGMFLRVADIYNDNSSELYLLSNEMDLGEIQLEQSGGNVTISRTVKSYKNEGELCFIAASYDENGVMTDAAQDKKTVNAGNTYIFSVTVGCDVLARVMLWGGVSKIEPYDANGEYELESVLLSSLGDKEGTNYGSVDASSLE